MRLSPYQLLVAASAAHLGARVQSHDGIHVHHVHEPLLLEPRWQCPRTPFQPQCSSNETIGTSQANSSENNTITERGHLWEVRPSPGKGLGVFATARIPFGQTILAEPALFTIQPPEFVPGHGYQLDAMAAAVDRAVAALAPSQQARYLAAHEHRFPGEPADSGRALRIFRSNAYSLDDGRVGMFPRAARINHSCRPNAANVWTGADGSARRVIWAARDIEPGEEILVTYVPLLKTAEERQRRLVQYGFRCGCEACSAAGAAGGQGDARRLHMGELLDELNDASRGLTMSKSASKKLRAKATELAGLVEEDGLADYWPQVYRLAAGFAERSGDRREAITWAEKEVEFHRFGGEDSTSTREALAVLKQLQQGA